MERTRALLNLVLMAWVAVMMSGVAEVQAQIPCGPQPKKPPKRISGGEGFPPLPLPVTPLRRTERKRPPAPPTIMIKMNCATEKVEVNGHTVWDWVTPKGDMQNLFRTLRSTLGIRYRGETRRVKDFDFRPEATPFIYFTGHKPIEFSPELRRALRQFVLDGGFILGAAASGDEPFGKAYVQEMRRLFPDRPWHILPPDHPVFHTHYDLNKVQYRRGAGDLIESEPHLEGINIGCRTAILFSPADLSCGWDHHTHPKGVRVMPKDATRLGVNMITYMLAYYRLGRITNTPVIFRETSGMPSQIRVGQVVHGGDWDPSPTGVQLMLKKVSEATSGLVSYRRRPVDPAKGEIFKCPFLFLTGHLDFTLSEAAVENLRQYLDRGGFLLISNCCNRDGFDRAVRRELARIDPDRKLKTMSPRHGIYDVQFDVRADDTETLRLEGIEGPDGLRVVYSPGSIATAWDQEGRPFVRLADSEAARQLGVNILVYTMTH